MDVGSEIGTKMRSAVKAKLFELGTGDSGYIDDELPDYIMIMIANKRSKEQMVVDLNLFLGEQTQHFVTWLHEVLQKLQEVTIPAAMANSVTNKKPKVVPKIDKEKKEKRTKDKKDKTKVNKKATTTITLGELSSINDVVADHLLEKAKKDSDIVAESEAHVKKVKTQTTTYSKHNDFDIPTISEISSTTDGGVVISGNREKDLAQLAEIQRKIYAAKKHLKQMGELDEDIESEDEDFLNLKDDDSAQDFDENGDLKTANVTTAVADKVKFNENSADGKRSPIVYAANMPTNVEINHKEGIKDKSENKQKEMHISESGSTVIKSKNLKLNETVATIATTTTVTTIANETVKTKELSKVSQSDREHERIAKEVPVSPEQSKKRSVHERLGMRQRQASEETEATRVRRPRQEKELYVPAFRRRETDNDQRDQRKTERGRERVRETERSRERSRERERSRGEREREREREARQRHAAHAQTSTVGRVIENNRRRSSSAESQDSTVNGMPRQRIGSRVIVAPVKPTVPSDSEDEDRPMNSVIKIKPRTPVSPSKQAPKNLLLRAVAEAQRSTILAKPAKKEAPPKRWSERLGEKSVRVKRSASTSSSVNAAGAALFRRTTQNLIIEVESKSAEINRQKRRRFSNELNFPSHKMEHDEEEYVPNTLSDRGDSESDMAYEPKSKLVREANDLGAKRSKYMSCEDHEEDDVSTKTQFVVTLNDDKALPKYRSRPSGMRTPSTSPQPQVTSSSSNSAKRRERARDAQRVGVKSRLSLKATSSSSLSPHTAARLSERESNNSTPVSNSPKRARRSDRVEIYRKPKDIKKIIIQNDSEDDDLSPKKVSPHEQQRKRVENEEEKTKTKTILKLKEPLTNVNIERQDIESSTKLVSTRKRKRTPIKFEENESNSRQLSEYRREEAPTAKKRRSHSREHNESEHEHEATLEHGRKISIRNAEARKYDNIPALSSVALDTIAMKVSKPKERCKYHPNCTKQFCEYYHPTAPCKSFPNCKYGDKCMYSHPNCKYDLACTNLDCNFAHSGARNPSQLQPTAPPLSSHVVPVQNYKSISSANVAVVPPPTLPSSMCKYFPNCTKAGCTFIHPKLCRYGKNCINPSCNYYHHDAPSSSKFKWVASVV